MTGLFGATRVNTKLTGVIDMRAITKFAAAAVLSLTMAGAASASTLITVASSNNTPSASINWDGTGAGKGTLFSGTGGVLGSISTILNFDDALFNDGGFGQAAFLTLVATADNGTVDLVGTTFRQDDLDGYFEFRTAANGGGTMLLRGDFTGMWLNGRIGDTAGGAQTILSGGTLNLTSDVVQLNAIDFDNAGFSFSSVSPAFKVTGGQLRDFTASNVVGTFGGVVPEPGTWALMIIGFGGAGAMIRSRRRDLVKA